MYIATFPSYFKLIFLRAHFWSDLAAQHKLASRSVCAHIPGQTEKIVRTYRHSVQLQPLQLLLESQITLVNTNVTCTHKLKESFITDGDIELKLT